MRSHRLTAKIDKIAKSKILKGEVAGKEAELVELAELDGADYPM
jgi:hypothetical protein